METFCNIINTRNELADFLEIPIKKLTFVLYVKKVDSYYTTFEIPKKNGGKRQINAPVGILKTIQEKLADALWEHQDHIWKEKNVRPCMSHAFEKGKSIITNAKVHINKRFLLNVDLENFFDSFHFGRVRGFFEKNREFHLTNQVATVIAQLVCYKGCLPQGAPTSPIIANLICQILDIRLLKIAKKYKVDYTRYADDLTFSTNNKAFLEEQDHFFIELSKEIENAGFTINKNKTRLQFRDSRQEVTGLIVNKKVNVRQTYYRKTKAMAHSLYTKGSFEIDGVNGMINQLEGRFSFINQLDKYNNQLDKNSKHCFMNLNGREKQYQKFLFYKYFFFNDKPLIVTEGKTDIIYLKSALKKLYVKYPDLITKKSSGKFEFKISFLRRSKRLRHFLGISLDGADTMKNIYDYFSNCRNGVNYWEYFKKICAFHPKNPVILIFDNELDDKNKPLSKFIQNVNCKAINKSKDELMKTLKEELSVQLIDKGNLFLATNPLVDQKQECEIEELFLKETFSHVINGKTFSLEEDYDNNKYYGKKTFSEYISTNYEEIDFSKFTEFLDCLNNIVKSYQK